MAALDDAVSLLSDGTNLYKTDYLPGFHENWHFFGATVNRIFRPSKRKTASNLLEVKTESSKMRAGRFGSAILAPFPTPQTFGSDKYQLTFSEDGSTNDFPRHAVPIRITWFDLEQMAASEDRAGAVVAFADHMQNHAMKAAAEAVAVHRHIPRSCEVAFITGTPKNNDAVTFSGATSYTPGSTSCLFQIDTGSIAAIQQGMQIEIRNSSGTLLHSAPFATVMDVNTADKSVSISVASGNCDSIADNGQIYFSGEYSAAGRNGLNSLYEWNNEGSTIYGKNRTTAGNQYLNTTQINAGGATLDSSHFDSLSDAMGYVMEGDSKTPVCLTTPENNTRLRQLRGEDAFIQIPTNDNSNIFARFGFNGVVYSHPTFGQMAITGDPLCRPDRAYFCFVQDWECVYPQGSAATLKWLPGSIAGNWNWLPHGDGTNDGMSLVLESRAMMLMNDICLSPRMQGVIHTLGTS